MIDKKCVKPCSLESRNYINKTIPNVIKDDDNIISKQEEIRKGIQLFYSTLYKNYDHDAAVNIENVFDNLKDHPILTEEEKMNLEGKISEDEIALYNKKRKIIRVQVLIDFRPNSLNSFLKILKYLLKMQLLRGTI